MTIFAALYIDSVAVRFLNGENESDRIQHDLVIAHK
jgi:hypothetical protein